MADEPARRPGDLLFDRILPHATAEERELAHENLRHFASMLLNLAKRDVREDQALDSPQSPGCDTMFLIP